MLPIHKSYLDWTLTQETLDFVITEKLGLVNIGFETSVFDLFDGHLQLFTLSIKYSSLHHLLLFL